VKGGGGKEVLLVPAHVFGEIMACHFFFLKAPGGGQVLTNGRQVCQNLLV
jgi:hypothetical protein